MSKLACDTKRKQPDKEYLREFSPTERIILKIFNFSDSDVADNELQHF